MLLLEYTAAQNLCNLFTMLKNLGEHIFLQSAFYSMKHKPKF